MTYVMRVPSLSTAHVPTDFDIHESGGLFAAYDYGFFLFLGEYPDAGEPEWITKLRDWALPQGFGWVRFDCDGDEVEELEKFTWE